MFKPLEPQQEPVVTFSFDGAEILAPAGTTIAAALLASGRKELRSTPVSGSPRGPFCMMGACFECLVQIDGETVQACMTPVSAGLEVSRVGRPASTPMSSNAMSAPTPPKEHA